MILFSLSKVTIEIDKEFSMNFSVSCSFCNIASGQSIEGEKMTRIKVSCPSCKNYISVDIIPTIEHTMKHEWNYEQDTIDEVMNKLKRYSKI